MTGRRDIEEALQVAQQALMLFATAVLLLLALYVVFGDGIRHPNDGRTVDPPGPCECR